MKKIIFLIALSSFSLFSEAQQVKTPAASLKAEVEQMVGLTDVEYEYSRPNKKGRVIFGGLVPYGQVWRTGANENTTIKFGDDVEIDGKTIPKGKYAIYTIPREDSWDVIFYSDSENWGTPEKWDDKKVVLKTTVPVKKLAESVESFTIGINNLSDNSAHLQFMWDQVLVDVTFHVPTQKIANASIDGILSNPRADANAYYASANYYLQSNGDMKKALNWINRAIDLKQGESPYWYYRVKSQIQAKLGDIKGAIDSAEKSLDGAQKEGNKDYIRLNNESIKEWKKIL
ncbi:DUF2911 domain-containing protein [Apibacter sp. B3706]|uniref:DUF2911 domain-containing protein n=1 Tax=Apibacter sp. B3706 TaxID=2656760 RepID=UPI00140AC8C7|nr:DUF2911 domain-containing protein [Apibacter sp. B3706]QII70751.1 DUF2911 domain-containing protein [Apibacter sp. B3706]